MPRGPILSDFEKFQIMTLYQEGFIIIAIAKRLKMGGNITQQYLSSPDTYGTKKNPGRPSKLTKRDKRRMISAASNSEQSAKQIKETQDIQISTRRVEQILSSIPHLKYKKRKPRPGLTKTHIGTRLRWA